MYFIVQDICNQNAYIMKTSPCNLYPCTPHFYIVKLGFTGKYIFFLIFAIKHRLWVLVRTATIYVLSKNKKKNQKNFSENYHFNSCEILQYIARTCLRNVFDLNHASMV